jgi:hypothetical protein
MEGTPVEVWEDFAKILAGSGANSMLFVGWRVLRIG